MLSTLLLSHFEVLVLNDLELESHIWILQNVGPLMIKDISIYIHIWIWEYLVVAIQHQPQVHH